ncbi:MAG: KH domain-containing protein [Deltaproteobacteria bacterium]|nr:KH domain-containing protein [Deltaproteobacteria bacterium]PNV85419.1 MAG: RNA-binding protein [Desulfobacteraceae bacterium]MDH3801380.1 KH domain-containing protein [Deltaproteobacteria bacterium]MDH3852205.1 KH domain-containing protein [Deltaproteobacteria bacterium]MDH3895821.1 KH domain-containing protein [Deltaproteobacteria bacterium]
MKTLVEYIVKALVDDTDQIVIAERTGRNTTIIELSVAKEDIGKVIGKEGRTINAIRTIVNAAGASQKKRVVLEVMG